MNNISLTNRIIIGGCVGLVVGLAGSFLLGIGGLTLAGIFLLIGAICGLFFALLEKTRLFPSWLVGTVIAEVAFITGFILIGGFSGRSENYGFLFLELPVSPLLPFASYLYHLVLGTTQTTSSFVFVVIPICYALLGILIGGIANIKKIFRKDVSGRMSLVWLVAFIILIISIVFYGYMIYASNHDRSVLEKASNPTSIDDCNQLPNSLNKYACIKNIAWQKSDASICDQIEGPGIVGDQNQAISMRYDCYSDVGVKTKDMKVCGLIGQEDMYSSLRAKCLTTPCFSMPFGSERNMCYYNVALETKDSVTCNDTGNDLIQKCHDQLRNK